MPRTNKQPPLADVAASPLGKTVSYRSEYAPELLFPIARQSKRQEIGVNDQHLPFIGEDLWNAYEISWLNTKGKPMVAMGQFRIPVASACLIESKSLKLYLNSFNQTVCASEQEVSAVLVHDLSRATGAQVNVQLRLLHDMPPRVFDLPGEGERKGLCIDHQDIEIYDYQPSPDFLMVDTARGEEVEDEILYSHLLKSNCLVTGQPDWGMLAVRYTGTTIDRAGLLRYIVSLRQHNEFHEQCVERVYMEILERCKPRKLAVWARYTRRGGLDINPFRASEEGLLPGFCWEIRQ